MNETYVTIRGNATEDPRRRTTAKGEQMVTLRLASTPWRYDSEQRGYVDGSTNFVTVLAFRALAGNIAASVHKGDPVVVHGELQVSQWEQADGRKGTTVEVRATSVGHDLARGVSSFTKAGRSDGGHGDLRRPAPFREAAVGAAAEGAEARPAESVRSPQTSRTVDPARADTDEYVVRSA